MVRKNENINVLQEGKTISIDNLPDCQHKARLLFICKEPTDKIVVLAVLETNLREWSAYAGYPDADNLKDVFMGDGIKYDYIWLCRNVRDIEQVRIMGEKLPEDVAKQLFNDEYWGGKIYKE